jgi:acetyl esterase/lipase
MLTSAAIAAPEPIALWPLLPPGEKGDIGPEADMTKPDENLIAGRRVIRLGNVSTPTLTVYKPAKDKDTGAAVLVCPGGGYYILAWDLEGTEVCDWLNSIGVTGVLLKYRVPRRPDSSGGFAPLQDAQRAMGLIRQHAADWAIDPNKIGVLGFSAGGNLSALLCSHDDTRAYGAIDAADQLNCRPNFAILVYPGGLASDKDLTKLSPNLSVTDKTPPTFLVMAQDDPVKVEHCLVYYAALKEAKVPAEMHLYAKGGHGYGLRPAANPVTLWPKLCEVWMRGLKILQESK